MQPDTSAPAAGRSRGSFARSVSHDRTRVPYGDNSDLARRTPAAFPRVVDVGWPVLAPGHVAQLAHVANASGASASASEPVIVQELPVLDALTFPLHCAAYLRTIGHTALADTVGATDYTHLPVTSRVELLWCAPTSACE